MKNIILVTFLLISLNIFSQTSTEKWSSLNNRYEYFDSSGYMTGYKEYNSLMGTWDYYSEKQRPRQNQYNPIVNPINENLVRQVLSSKQARYDGNVTRVRNAIADITDKMNALEISVERNESMIERLNNEYVNVISGKNYDYSSQNVTNQIINWLYAGANTIIREE